MNTPFEDLEYLADYLPEEGEAVIVARRGGGLGGGAFRPDSPPERGLGGGLYGPPLEGNERLNAVGALPIWGSALACFGLCVGIHKLFSLGWSGWYIDLGILLVLVSGCYGWIQFRQRQLFRRQVRPMIETQLRTRGVPKF